MKNDKKQGPQGKESEPSKPLKKMSDLLPDTDKRKEKSSWSEVDGEEELRKKKDDKQLKK